MKPWQSAYADHVGEEFEFPKISIYEMFRQSEERHPDKPAIHFFDYQLTYQELHRKVKAFACSLRSLGVKKGDRIGVLLPNCPQYVVSYYALMSLGAVVVQISPFYTHHEMEKIVEDAGCNLIICLDMVSGELSDLKNQSSIRDVILVSLASRLSLVKSIFYRLKLWTTLDALEEDYLDHVLDFDHLLEQYFDQEYEAADVAADDLAVLQYTGGTTGLPKGAMLSHSNIVSNAYMLKYWAGAEETTEKVLAVLPLFHSYGMTVNMNYAMLNGGQLILLPRFTPKGVLDAFEKFKPNFFPGIPSIYHALGRHMKQKGIKTTGLRDCISGAAPLPLEVKHSFEEQTGATVVEGFGLSEASPVTHCNPLRGGEVREGSIGVPLPGTEAKICDMETHEELALGETGELVIKGPQIMQGYWQRGEETRKSLADGWLYTGDLAEMDEDGYFYIVGRKKNMIITSGLNVYPVAIEDHLLSKKGVLDCAVMGIADEEKGEIVKAYIVLEKGKKLSPEDLNKHCREHLAGYKCPVNYEFLDEIPRSFIGKTLYRELAKMEAERVEA